nr:class IV lanthionine synthetase LanL [Kitasatospora cheerisanensis]
MEHDRDAPFSTLVRSVLDRTGRAWSPVAAPPWVQHLPPNYRPRAQGWKIHVSATPLSAPDVLRRSAAVLAAHSCAFKHAADAREVERLTATRCDRAAAGKFLTAYPDDDPHFRAVAADLARALDGLPGPAVLSDRPVRRGGIVSYRYGVFAAPARLNNDGSFESVLTAPDGTLVPDRPVPWFAPPPWAADPLGAQPAEDAAEVLVGGRFAVRGAIRHAYRGGVYRAVDRDTGAPVVLKQARRHVAVAADGSDVRELLRGEARALKALAATGLAPRPVGLVEQDGDLFLAQSELPGVTLEQWVGARVLRDRGLPADACTGMAREVVEAAAAIAREGLVWLDLNPGNLMVGPDGRLRLVDLEGMVEPGARGTRMYTPAYAAPEQLADPFVPLTATTCYGLGATLFFLTSGIHPALPDDDRPRHRRLTEWLAALAVDNPAARRLQPLIAALTADDPAQRWTPAQARAFLDHPPATRPPAPPRPVPADRLLRDGLAHTVATMDAADPARLWPAPAGLEACDPRAVQHGAAGTLAVLDRALRTLPDPDPALLPALATAAGWLDARLTGRQRLLPGLYFGHAGTAWALYDAAGTLHDPALAERALDLAARLPTRWPNPDVCHGAAGCGLAHLALGQRTGDERFAAGPGSAPTPSSTARGPPPTASAGPCPTASTPRCAASPTSATATASPASDCSCCWRAVNSPTNAAWKPPGRPPTPWSAPPPSRTARPGGPSARNRPAPRRCTCRTGAPAPPASALSCSATGGPPATSGPANSPDRPGSPSAAPAGTPPPGPATAWPGTASSCSTWPRRPARSATAGGPRTCTTLSRCAPCSAAAGTSSPTRPGAPSPPATAPDSPASSPSCSDSATAAPACGSPKAGRSPKAGGPPKPLPKEPDRHAGQLPASREVLRGRQHLPTGAAARRGHPLQPAGRQRLLADADRRLRRVHRHLRRPEHLLAHRGDRGPGVTARPERAVTAAAGPARQRAGPAAAGHLSGVAGPGRCRTAP